MNKTIGYVRVSSRKQIDRNSIEQQKEEILNRYPSAEIKQEIFSGAKERAIFNKVINEIQEGDTLVV